MQPSHAGSMRGVAHRPYPAPPAAPATLCHTPRPTIRPTNTFHRPQTPETWPSSLPPPAPPPWRAAPPAQQVSVFSCRRKGLGIGGGRNARLQRARRRPEALESVPPLPSLSCPAVARIPRFQCCQSVTPCAPACALPPAGRRPLPPPLLPPLPPPPPASRATTPCPSCGPAAPARPP